VVQVQSSSYYDSGSGRELRMPGLLSMYRIQSVRSVVQVQRSAGHNRDFSSFSGSFSTDFIS
jgi:hypothetical protein